jgi:hypothetical protein
VPQGVSFGETTRVNGRSINGPGSKTRSIDYIYHGSIGPKIYGNRRLRLGDDVELTVTLSGSATNPRGSRIYFSAAFHEVCQVS